MRKLLGAACLALALVGCASASSPSPAPTRSPLTVRDFTLDPTTITLHEAVNLVVTNQGPTVHNVSIRDEAGTTLAATNDLKEGQSQPLSASLAPGTYTLFCSLPGHESLGIKGTLVIVP